MRYYVMEPRERAAGWQGRLLPGELPLPQENFFCDLPR